jgi:hypothetical protein
MMAARKERLEESLEEHARNFMFIIEELEEEWRAGTVHRAPLRVQSQSPFADL